MYDMPYYFYEFDQTVCIVLLLWSQLKLGNLPMNLVNKFCLSLVYFSYLVRILIIQFHIILSKSNEINYLLIIRLLIKKNNFIQIMHLTFVQLMKLCSSFKYLINVNNHL